MKWRLTIIGIACALAFVHVFRNELFFAFYQSGLWH